jgi:hypothetical protein
MKASPFISGEFTARVARFGAALGVLLATSLFIVGSASASFEQVATFAGGSGSPLEGAKGLAVNEDGAGGVAPGTVYAVASAPPSYKLLRYTAKGELVGSTDIAGTSDPGAVAIDQATGNVYVLIHRAASGSPKQVLVYSPDGSNVIASFGEQASENTSIEASPEKLHVYSRIAVDSLGTVYVTDAGYTGAKESGGQHSRVMVFKPQTPGDYEHYVYSGQQNDIAPTSNGNRYENGVGLAVDFAGNLYLAGESEINEFAPGERLNPVCSFELPISGIQGMTVNPESGDVVYDGYRPTDGKGHQLTCNSQGKFVEVGSFSITPRPTGGLEVKAFAFNPAISWGEGRPAGVFYAASDKGLGYIFGRAIEIPPTVESESTSRVGATTATIEASINPKGSRTSYVFQYLTDAAYEANEPSDRFAGASEVPLGGAVLGEGQQALGAAAPVSGLTPDTAYRYRVIATSHCSADEAQVCEAVGSAQVFRTFPLEAPGLPDGRTYELVSPADKHGGEVFPAQPEESSCGGECKPGFLLQSFPMQSSPDGEAVVYEGFPFSFSEGASIENQYISHRNPSSGWETTILSPVLEGSGEGQGYKAFDASLTQGVLYQLGAPLSPEAPSEYGNLYTQPASSPSTLGPLLKAEPPNRFPGRLSLTYAGASADLSRVFFEANDALTGETPFAPEAMDGGESKNNLYEWTEGELHLVNVLPGNSTTSTGAMFGSGTLLAYKGNLRVADVSNAISDDGTRAFWSSESGQVYVRENGETTREIPDHAGKFLTASPDGSKLLLSDGNLFDIDDESSTDLTEGKGGFQGISGQSKDLSSIYFVDTAVLDETPNGQGAVAQAGQNNLYVWHEGASHFIATLLPQDSPVSESPGTWNASPGRRTAEASPNGRWLAFFSYGQLTGQSTGYGKVFLYDSLSGRLACASCNPSQEKPLGGARLRTNISSSLGSIPQPRYLTDSGRVYFDSQDSLSVFDTNEGVEDVYQYEPEGVGGCKRAEGCINLISAGHEPVDSNLVTIDETGKNVFFTSRDRLVLKDKDGLIDLYDAREGGGIPAESEVSRGECQGEACQVPVSPPNDPTPGSSTFQGAGNVNEPKAAKKHAKKHKKKRHAKKHSKKHAHQRAAKHNRGGVK